MFASRAGKRLTSIKTAWNALCERASVPQARFHDLRHTFTTRMLEAGVDVRTIMAVTGHKDVSMFARYSHPTDTHLKAAVESISPTALVSNLVTVAHQARGTASKSLKGL